jgi:hypothetical protein
MQELDVLPIIMSGWGTLIAVWGRRGGLREVVSRTGQHRPCRELLFEFFCLLGGRVTEFVRFRNYIIVCGRSRSTLPTSPTKALTRPKGKIAPVFLPGLRHHRTAPVSCLFSANRMFTSNPISLAIMTAIITSSRPSDLNADEGLCRKNYFHRPGYLHPGGWQGFREADLLTRPDQPWVT